MSENAENNGLAREPIQIPKGNDFDLTVALSLVEDGEATPYDLTGAQSVRLFLKGHGMLVPADNVRLDGTHEVAGKVPGRSLLAGTYGVGVTFRKGGYDKRIVLEDIIEVVETLTRDTDGEAEGEGGGVRVVIAVTREVIGISSGERNVIETIYVNGVEQEVVGKAVFITVPTTLAELSGDSDHRTVTDTEKAAWDAKQGAIADLDDIRAGAALGATAYRKPQTGIPDTDLSEGVRASLGKADTAYQKPQSGIPATDLAAGVIPDVSNFITKSVNDLVNYYLKSETYSKSETNNLIAAVKQFRYEVVSTLPAASSETMGIIYLVPSEDPQAGNVKDEWITIDNGSGAQERYTWEQIGSTAVDLSGYVTTTALNTALASYTTTADLTTLLAAKQDVIDSTHKLDPTLIGDWLTAADVDTLWAAAQEIEE